VRLEKGERILQMVKSRRHEFNPSITSNRNPPIHKGATVWEGEKNSKKKSHGGTNKEVI